MELLFIGGSRFVGKHMVLEAVRRGHSVTLFNRGTGPLPSESVRHIQGDRNSDLHRLTGERFDAVVDTSGYLPRQVRTAAEALAGRVASFLFISTISVYADRSIPHQDEEARLAELEDPEVEEVTGETYGGLKVLCERTLTHSFPGRRLVLRPGVVVGPDDPTDRFTYWPVRIARGGEVLAPNRPEHPVQWIDARDLASFSVDLLEREAEGTYNAVSEADRFTLGDLLETSRRVTGSDARITWVKEEFLLERDVKPFTELPLWIPGEDANFSRVDASRAYSEGLTIRPLEDTIRGTLAWYDTAHRGRPEGTGEAQSPRAAGESGVQSERPMKAGLTPDRERELLAGWHAASTARGQID